MEIVRNDYGANIMARTELVPQGFAKFIFHKDNLVGATVVGAGADIKTLQSWIIPHPTLSECLGVRLAW